MAVTLARILGAVVALALYGIIAVPLNSLLSTKGSTPSTALAYVQFFVFMTVGAIVGEHALRWLNKNRPH